MVGKTLGHYEILQPLGIVEMWPFGKRKHMKPGRTVPTDLPPEDEDLERVMSLLSPEEVEELGGLPGPDIYGTLRSASTGTVFCANPAFVQLMHEVVAAAGPGDPDLNHQAYTENGPVRLPPHMYEALVEKLQSLQPDASASK